MKKRTPIRGAFHVEMHNFKNEHKLTVKQISAKSGMDESDVSKILNGQINPGLVNLLRLIDGMNGKLVIIPA